MSNVVVKTPVVLKNNSILYNNGIVNTEFKFIPLLCELDFDPSLQPINILGNSSHLTTAKTNGYIYTVKDSYSSITTSIIAGDSVFGAGINSSGIFFTTGTYTTPTASQTISFPGGSTGKHIVFNTTGTNSIVLPAGAEWVVLSQNIVNFSANHDNIDFSGTFIKRVHCTNSLEVIAHGALAITPFDVTGSITIPSSVNEIGDYAFLDINCKSLNLLSSNNLIIGKNPFALSSIELENKVGTNWEIYDNILYRDLNRINMVGAGWLYPRDLSIPSSVIHIGDFALYNQQNLHGQLILPPNLQTIGEYAIDSRNLTGELRIPSSITSLGPNAINQCPGLTILNIAPGYNPVANSTNYVFNCSNNFTADSLNQSIINIASGTKTVTIGATNKARLLAAYPQAQVNANARGITIV